MVESSDQTSTQQRLEALTAALQSGTAGQVRYLLSGLHPAETADLLESLPHGPRELLWELVAAEDQGEVLIEAQAESKCQVARWRPFVLQVEAVDVALESRGGVSSRVFSAFRIDGVCDHFQRDAVVAFMQQGGVAMLAAGTGNPFFTTDSAASLRAIEIGADLMIKATKVNGIYSDDPVRNPDAVFYETLDYDDVLSENLGVMDLNAILLCRDHDLPMRVMNIYQEGALQRLVNGEPVGTLVRRKSKE